MALERDIVDAWEACPARDAEGKEYYWQLYKNTRKFGAILQGYIQGGKAAKLQAPTKSVVESVSSMFRRQ